MAKSAKVKEILQDLVWAISGGRRQPMLEPLNGLGDSTKMTGGKRGD